MVPGISDQALVAIMIVGAALAFTGVGIISSRRLDASKRKAAAAEPRPEK